MSNRFSDWLQCYAKVVGVNDLACLEQERSLLVHNVICTFVSPVGDRQDVAAVLVDAGRLCIPDDNEKAEAALARNMENFLTGAPVFLTNPDTKRLVIGQKFIFSDIDPLPFSSVLEGLALQALAWQQYN